MKPSARMEGKRVRVRVDDRSYLVRLPDVASFEHAYRLALARVVEAFPPERTWAAGLGDEAGDRLRREIAMAWLYFYTVNDLAVDVTPTDLRAPATWRVLHAYARDVDATAILAGVTPAEIERFLEGDARYQDR